MLSTIPNIISRRDLLRELVLSDLRASTAGTAVGWLWWLLDPLIMMLIYWGIVSGLFGRGGAAYAPYPIFLLCALIAWKHFATSAQASTRVLRNKETLIKSVPFPTIVLPLSIVLSGFAYFLFGFAVLLVAAAVWPNAQHTGRLLPLTQVVPLMALQIVVTMGVCLALSSIGVLLRDLGLFITHLLRIGFYVSPGLFGIDMVRRMSAEKLGEPAGQVVFALYMLNPFAIIITGYREAVFYGGYLPLHLWLVLAVEAGVVALVGYRIYQHYDRRVIKFL